MAEVTVTGVSSTTTFTASYSNVSDTCTVTVQSYLFYDDCSVDNTNQYTSTFVYWDSGQPTKTLSFVTDHYELTRNVSNFILMQLPMSANDDFIFTADILPSSTSMDNGGGIGIGVNTSNKGIGFHQTNSSSTAHLLLYNPQEGQGGVVSNVTTPNYVVDDYHTHRITKSGASFKYEVLHNDTVLFTYTKDDLATVFSSDVYPAISMGKNGALKIKNIKVEAL